MFNWRVGLRSRRYGRWLSAIASAMIFHFLLLAMIVSWKQPAMGQIAKAIDLSLVSGTGLSAVAARPSTPTLAPIESKMPPTVAKLSIPMESALNPISSLLLKPRLELDPPKDVTSLVAALTSGAPSLRAEPISIAPHANQASPVPAPSAGGKTCQILETLKTRLQGSEEVKAALLLIPAKSLSVAKAIVLWDDRWIDSSSMGGSSGLQTIERVVVQVVDQAPPNCQVELLHGVRFITLGDARDTTVLAFGSTDWRWADVLATVSPTKLQ